MATVSAPLRAVKETAVDVVISHGGETRVAMRRVTRGEAEAFIDGYRSCGRGRVIIRPAEPPATAISRLRGVLNELEAFVVGNMEAD